MVGLIRTFLCPTRTCSLMPFFDKKRDRAVYVLISFSRNLTARRLDSSIAASQPVGRGRHQKIKTRRRVTRDIFVLARARPTQILDLPEKHKNNYDYESKAYSARRDIAPLTAMRPPQHSPQERQDQNHD